MLPGGTTTTNERTNEQQGKIGLLSLWAVGRLSFAISELIKTRIFLRISELIKMRNAKIFSQSEVAAVLPRSFQSQKQERASMKNGSKHSTAR